MEKQASSYTYIQDKKMLSRHINILQNLLVFANFSLLELIGPR